MGDVTEKYEQARMALDLIDSEKATAKKSVTAAVQPELDAIDEEFGPQIEAANKALAEAETELRAAVLIGRETVKGKHVTASYVKGRDKMNMEAVKGFMRAHNADASMFIEHGEPGVSLRWTR